MLALNADLRGIHIRVNDMGTQMDENTIALEQLPAVDREHPE